MPGPVQTSSPSTPSNSLSFHLQSLGRRPSKEERQVIETALTLMKKYGCRSDYPLHSVKYDGAEKEWVLSFEDSDVSDAGIWLYLHDKQATWFEAQFGGTTWRTRFPVKNSTNNLHWHWHRVDIGYVEIMAAIILYLAPEDSSTVQVWPYAADPSARKKEVMVTYQKDARGWYQDWENRKGPCILENDGKMRDEAGKVFLDIKSNLKVSHGTNYVFKPKDWDNPLEFSLRDNKESRTFEIKEGGKTVREFKAKLSKSHE